jgi:hypothetical protein
MASLEAEKLRILKSQHMLNVLYYHYFLFYTKILREDDPHFTTYFALSASIGFVVNGIIDVVALNCFCISVGRWPMIVIFLVILGVNYYIFGFTGNGERIKEQKPLICKSSKLSISFTITFFIISTSWLFWGPIYGKFLLEKCP